MTRDIIGAFIPEQVGPIEGSDKKDEKQKKVAPLEKVFEGTMKNDMFEMLTFITDNPLEVYLGAKGAEPKPRTARVVYRLEPEKNRKNSYMLVRQEGQKLAMKLYAKDAKEQMRAYPIIEGIQSCIITYLQEEVKKEGEPSKRTFKRTKTWTSETKKEGQERTITLPYAVEIELTLWDTQFEQKKKFIFTVPLYGQLSWQEPKKSQTQKQASAQKSIEPEQGKNEETKKEDEALKNIQKQAGVDKKNSRGIVDLSQKLKEVLAA